MVGTSTMISYIQRDENQHCYFFAEAFKQLMLDFPELATAENEAFAYETFDQAIQYESEWAHSLLSEVPGIDLEEFDEYIRFIANKRLKMMGLAPAYEHVENVMPWIRPFSDDALNATKTDFFESKSRTYAVVQSDNGFDDL